MAAVGLGHMLQAQKKNRTEQNIRNIVYLKMEIFIYTSTLLYEIQIL
jgi:hypothetical protein